MHWYTLDGTKNTPKSSLISLCYSFAFPYFIYCNHVWGSTYQTNLKNDVLVQKKSICIIAWPPCKTYAEALITSNRLTPLSNINMYMACIFVYICLQGCVPDIFNDFYTSNRNVHGRDTHQVCDLHAPYGRLHIRWNSMKEHGGNMSNSIPENVKLSESINAFRQRLHNCLSNGSSIH